MKLHTSTLLSTLLVSLGLLTTASSAGATVLLDLVNAPSQTNTAYALTFTASDVTTTLSVAGNQVPSWEYASLNGLFLNGTGANLLGANWNFVAAASGTDAGTTSDGTNIPELFFGGTNTNYVDTFSQTIATTIGSSYTYDFLFTEDSPGPNEFIVSTTSTSSDVPEPESLALVGLGLAGLGFMRRKAKKA